MYINNQKYKIVGNVCMDMLFVEIDENVNLYDKVEILKDNKHIEEVAKYLETMATCRLSLSGYSKQFMQKMQILGEMVYPRLNSKKSYGPMSNSSYSQGPTNTNNVFSNSMNNTLNQMKNKY